MQLLLSLPSRRRRLSIYDVAVVVVVVVDVVRHAEADADVPSYKFAADMKSVTLNNGVVMPTVSMGTARYIPNIEVVRNSFDFGYRHWDVSDNHGYDINRKVGEALSIYPRSSYFLTTKVTLSRDPMVTNVTNAYAHTMATVKRNLQWLGKEYVDATLLHYPMPTCEATREQWRALEDAYAAGLTRSIGVSNFCVYFLQCVLGAAKVMPALNEVHFHAGIDDRESLLNWSRQNGIVLLAYGAALGSEYHFMGDRGGAQLSERWKEAAQSAVDRTLQLAKHISREHCAQWSRSGGGDCPSAYQVLYRRVLEQGVATIVESTQPEHQKANIDILKFGLTRHDTEAFVELAKWPVSPFSGLGRVTAYGAACYGRAPS